MAQTATTPTIPAGEALWAYWGVSETPAEHDFFASLERKVADAIHIRARASGRIWVGREMRLRIGQYQIAARLVNLEPVLATTITEDTRTSAQYIERDKEDSEDISAFVSEIIRYPNDQADKIFGALVGLKTISDDMFRKLALLVNPATTDTWVQRQYGTHPPSNLLNILRDRYPLLILEGEVGSGKTALARSIGGVLATTLHTELALFVVNSQVRGGGHVGELTQNIARAFVAAERTQEREQIPVLILIDEADALAQARGGRQTHHEDDAGVNALIQRIDRLRGRPMAVLFATNLVQSLDAAILRRAVASYHFQRPTATQRAQLFRRVLRDMDLSDEQLNLLATATEPRVLPGYGSVQHRFTYSDLTQRILPMAVEKAIWDQKPLTVQALKEACDATTPTPEAPQNHS
ncbi:MAG: ATP-binding protein [Ktedonobacterales bacterium]